MKLITAETLTPCCGCILNRSYCGAFMIWCGRIKGVFDISYKHASEIGNSAYKSDNVTNTFLQMFPLLLPCSHADMFYKSRQSPKVFWLLYFWRALNILKCYKETQSRCSGNRGDLTSHENILEVMSVNRDSQNMPQAIASGALSSKFPVLFFLFICSGVFGFFWFMFLYICWIT